MDCRDSLSVLVEDGRASSGLGLTGLDLVRERSRDLGRWKEEEGRKRVSAPSVREDEAEEEDSLGCCGFALDAAVDLEHPKYCSSCAWLVEQRTESMSR